MACALYNGITLPIDICFNPAWMETRFCNVLNSIIDVSFLLDIIVVFRTTITGEDGEDVYDSKIIAKKYLAN